MIQNKRQNSIIIPYKLFGDKIEVYLQKRSVTATALPDYFGFWGGGAENNETPEQALLREVKEEMGIDLDLTSVKLLNRYEFLRNVKYVYIFESPEKWEDKIVIGEGDYGKWFTTEDALNIEKFIFEDKVIVNDLERILLKKPIR